MLTTRSVPHASTLDIFQSPVPCAAGCGAIFCSDACRSLCWDLGHSMLCLGVADDEDHPLVRHKVSRAQNPDLSIAWPFLVRNDLLELPSPLLFRSPHVHCLLSVEIRLHR